VRIVANPASRSVPAPQYAFLAFATSSPNMAAYRWDFSSAGFGVRYSNPATVLSSGGRDVSLPSDNAEVAFASDNSPFVFVYPWSDSGFGTKFANPASPVNGLTGRATAFNKNGNYLAVMVNSAFANVNRVETYNFSSSGFGSKLAIEPDPVVTSSGAALKGTWNASDSLFTVSTNGTAGARIRIYNWNNSTTWGTVFSTPATTPTGSGTQSNFNPSASDVAISHETAPYVTAYPYTTSYGTKYANPATAITGNGEGVSWSRDGSAIAVAHNSSPYLSVYAWSSGFGTKYADPSSGPGNTSTAVDWSKDGKILVGESNSPYVAAWEWNAGFGTKMSAPSSTPETIVYGVKFSN